MTLYRKKPVVIEAIKLTADNYDEVERFVGVNSFNRAYTNEVDFIRKENPIGIHIKTLEGTIIASNGDYVIKGVAGEFYPCKPDIFAETYDKVEYGE